MRGNKNVRIRVLAISCYVNKMIRDIANCDLPHYAAILRNLSRITLRGRVMSQMCSRKGGIVFFLFPTNKRSNFAIAGTILIYWLKRY